MYCNFDTAYKHIAHQILNKGHRQQIQMESGLQETLSLFNTSWTFHGSLVPLLSLRKVNVSLIIKELNWIISGSSSILPLGSHQFIWSPWADLDGDLQSAYGRLLRHYPVSRGNLGVSLFGNPGLDQIAYLKQAFNKPNPSRRIQLTLAHPEDTALSNLPPCMSGLGFNWWISSDQPHVRQVSLNIKFRSSDFCVGFVFDIFQWYLFTQVLLYEINQANPELNYRLSEYTFSADNQHIYNEHLSQLETILSRDTGPCIWWSDPHAEPTGRFLTIQSGSTLENFKYALNGYEPHPFVKLPLIA
jgi:thymidylate synthase